MGYRGREPLDAAMSFLCNRFRAAPRLVSAEPSRSADAGAPLVIRLRVRKWRCEEPTGEPSIFAERLPGLVSPDAHQNDAIADVLAAMGHGAGGETSRRLLARLGIVASGDTILRHLRRQAQRKRRRSPRVVGVDEWAWRRGAAWGTILVNLETRAVADMLRDRSASSLTTSLRQHLGVVASAAIVTDDP